MKRNSTTKSGVWAKMAVSAVCACALSSCLIPPPHHGHCGPGAYGPAPMHHHHHDAACVASALMPLVMLPAIISASCY